MVLLYLFSAVIVFCFFYLLRWSFSIYVFFNLNESSHLELSSIEAVISFCSGCSGLRFASALPAVGLNPAHPAAHRQK
jgi:hypothetical protein